MSGQQFSVKNYKGILGEEKMTISHLPSIYREIVFIKSKEHLIKTEVYLVLSNLTNFFQCKTINN